MYNNEVNEPFNDLIVSEYKRCNNLDFFIKRGNIEFENYGRIHTLEESVKIDDTIRNLYKKYGASYIEVESRDAVDKIIPILLNKINSNVA